MTKFQEEQLYLIMEELESNPALKEEYQNVCKTENQKDVIRRLPMFDKTEHCYNIAKNNLKNTQ